MHLCRSCEAADYSYKVLKNFDGIMLLIYTLKGRNVHTCSNSKLYHELYHMGIIHRAQDNSWQDSWQFPIDCVVCPTTLVKYVMLSGQI